MNFDSIEGLNGNEINTMYENTLNEETMISECCCISLGTQWYGGSYCCRINANAIPDSYCESLCRAHSSYTAWNYQTTVSYETCMSYSPCRINGVMAANCNR